jgi:two-component system sensor histidine kinase MtrB
MLPAAPQESDYERLVSAFEIRGDFATLIKAGGQTYQSGFTVAPDLISDALAAKVAQGRIGYQMISIAGKPTLVVGGQAHSGALELYFFYDQGDRLAQLAQLRNTLIFGGVILAVLGAVVGFLLARGLVRPVRRASKAAVRMSQGDLGIRLPTGGDEFGVLASSFNRMAETLQAKMLDLEAGQARERRFVADVTHELRTPVSALVGEASLLKTKLQTDPSAFPPDVAHLVTMVNTDISRLRQLVDDLLEISRLEAQAAETLVEPVPLEPFLEQLLRAHDWSQKVALVSAGLSADTLVTLADRRRMERIVVNLVDNALQHGTAPVTLEIWPGTTPQGERIVQVAVTDSGPGIPPEHLPNIFDRFYKADPSRASSRGSGLGLAIARENARLLGGDVTAANVPGGGARFLLTLPAAQGWPFEMTGDRATAGDQS